MEEEQEQEQKYMMLRIAVALEKIETIEDTNQANAQRYQQLRQELAADIKKALAERPTIKNNLDAQELAKYVLPNLLQGFPDTMQLKAVGDEIVNQLQAERARIPTRIAIEGDFYGFTSWKPMLAYLGVLLVCGAACAEFAHEKQATVQYQQAQELLKERNYLHSQIENYRSRYPQYANGLFPPYDDKGFWKSFNFTLTEPGPATKK